VEQAEHGQDAEGHSQRMQPRPTGVEDAEALAAHERQQHHQTEHAAEKHNLEAVQFPTHRLDHAAHGGEHHGTEQHEQGTAGIARQRPPPGKHGRGHD
jgi:hypothetical protein